MEVKKTDDGKVLSFETVRKPREQTAQADPVPPTGDELRAEVNRLNAIIAQRYQMEQAEIRDNQTVDEITLYLRDNYQREIAQGRHSGRSLAEVVIYYLSLERMYSRMPWWKLILRTMTRAE